MTAWRLVCFNFLPSRSLFVCSIGFPFSPKLFQKFCEFVAADGQASDATNAMHHAFSVPSMKTSTLHSAILFTPGMASLVSWALEKKKRRERNKIQPHCYPYSQIAAPSPSARISTPGWKASALYCFRWGTTPRLLRSCCLPNLVLLRTRRDQARPA